MCRGKHLYSIHKRKKNGVMKIALQSIIHVIFRILQKTWIAHSIQERVLIQILQIILYMCMHYAVEIKIS